MDRFLRRITLSITTDTRKPASKRSKSDACSTSADQSCSAEPRRESDEPDITPESVNVICPAASEVDIGLLREFEVINYVADFVPQNAIDFDENSTQASVTSCNLPSCLIVDLLDLKVCRNSQANTQQTLDEKLI